jgi:hypothetical protein
LQTCSKEKGVGSSAFALPAQPQASSHSSSGNPQLSIVPSQWFVTRLIVHILTTSVIEARCLPLVCGSPERHDAFPTITEKSGAQRVSFPLLGAAHRWLPLGAAGCSAELAYSQSSLLAEFENRHPHGASHTSVSIPTLFVD